MTTATANTVEIRVGRWSNLFVRFLCLHETVTVAAVTAKAVQLKNYHTGHAKWFPKTALTFTDAGYVEGVQLLLDIQIKDWFVRTMTNAELKALFPTANMSDLETNWRN